MTSPATQPRERSFFSTWGYLIFLGFVLLGPTFDPDPEPYRWPMEFGIVVVSAVTFIWGELGGRREASVGAIVLMIVALVATPFGSSSISVLPVYAAALIAEHGSRREVRVRLSIISVLTLAALLTSPVGWPFVLFLAIPVVLVWIVGMAVYEDAALMSKADSLRAENARIEYLATVTERERISRDLHDLAGQALTGLILRSQLVQRLVEIDPARALDEAAAIEHESRELLSRFREAVAGWLQASLADELEGARRALGAADVDVIEQVDPVAIAPSVETVLALALRESVTNVVRHASARSCRIALVDDVGAVTLSVIDDGVGGHGASGSGLRSMRERVVAAGGDLTVTDGSGTSVVVRIPIGAHT